MKIINGVLTEIADEDIIDGTFIVPNGVTSIGKFVFEECISLENIIIPESVISIEEYAFNGCVSLKNIIIPESVTNIGESAFRRCTSLENIIIPESVTNIEKSIFVGCTSLKNITIPQSITSIGDSTFNGCSSLENIMIPEGVTSIGKSAFRRCTSLKNITIPESVIGIGKSAFNGCSSLENIILPKNIINIGDSAFYECSSLEKITIPENVTSIGGSIFCGCDALKRVVILANITCIEEYTFYECSSLKEITIPESVTSIENSAFIGCNSLENIILPENVTKIGDFAFYKCSSLREITIPESVTSIEKSTFSGCISLENITIPESVTNIGESAFGWCSALENITIPESVTNIGESAFCWCSSLKNIVIPKSVTSIENFVFCGCSSLENITMSESVIGIGKSAFYGCVSLSSITTPWGEYKFTLLENDETHTVIANYLYLYANFILKEKYNCLEEFMLNSNINKLLHDENAILSNDGIQKFKNLFYKMRRAYDITPELFSRLSLKTTELFNFNTWNFIQSIFYSNGVSKDNIDMAEALSEIIEIFGLFHQDSDKDSRIQKFKEFMLDKPYRLSLDQYERFSCNQKESYFQKINTPYFVLKENALITEEFQIYLKSILSEQEIKKIKKLSGSYGKKINDFVKENYVTIYSEEYELKEKYYENEEINMVLFNQDILGHVNYSSLHRMFDGCNKEFSESFYQFMMENLTIILNDEKLQSMVKDIQNKFDSMKKHYMMQAGVENITLKQALDYLENQTFDYHDGNYEFSLDVKKAGVVNQETFNYYQKVFEKNNYRHLTSLVKRSNVYEINGYTIKAELLRSDDSFAMLVGENNYTNCCQRFGGVGHNCMAHAINSSDGGIFVTRLLNDGEWILLTESWDWQNNNLYCHDNIEGTPYFKKSSQELKEAVAKVFELDGKYIIEKSKSEVENYIKVRKKAIEKSISITKEQELEQLEELEKREVIRLVTTGSGNDDLGLFNYFSSSLKVNKDCLIQNQKFTLKNFQPVDYNATQTYFNKEEQAYTDSNQIQYIIAGSMENLCLAKLEPLVPIYRDDRRIVLETSQDVRNYTTKRIKDMEKMAYPENMLSHQNISKDDFSDSNIYLGEDWYLIYEEKENNSIYVSDLAKVKPDLNDESSIQNHEIMHVIYHLVRKYDTVEADLKEDTSYLLFLINKELGYLEQIGQDICYPFGNPSQSKVVTDSEQKQLLKNAKTIKENKNPEQIMHKVAFKRGKLLKNSNISHEELDKNYYH